MRKHNYVVGYEGKGQCVYGKREDDDNRYNWIDLMTLKQAQKLSKKIIYKYDDGKIEKSVIYKLVKVKMEDL